MNNDSPTAPDATAIVIDLPVRLKRFGSMLDVPLPILVVLRDNEPDVPSDAYQFALNRAQVENFNTLRRMLVAICSLYNFWLASELAIENKEEVDLVIWNYIGTRLAIVDFDTVRLEFCDIRTYVRFCRKQNRPHSPFAQALGAESRLFEFRMPLRPTAEFLQHLDVQRRRWLELQELEVVLPGDFRKLADRQARKSKRIVRFPTEDQMDDLIDCERNPMYRAAFCVLAGLGCRMSELLHMWRCDILPPSYADKFSGSSDGNPFVIFAHPETSTWTGESFDTRGARSRKVILDVEYGATSRRWMVPRKERHGWKGMMLFDQRNLSWGFWVVDRYAKEFARLLPAVYALHDELRTDEAHPYFWINPTNSKYRGLPMRYQVLSRAIGAACARIGIEPFMNHGGHGHGLRHFTAWYAESKLGLSPSEVQLVLRHGNVRSQEEYGRRVADLFSKLAKGRS